MIRPLPGGPLLNSTYAPRGARARNLVLSYSPFTNAPIPSRPIFVVFRPQKTTNHETAYGIPPTDVEAVEQNQGAVVWWKVPSPLGEDKPRSEQTGRAAKATKTKSTKGGASGKRGGVGGAAEEGLAGDGGAGGVVGGTGTGAAGSVLEENPTPETVGFVVYRYRLDGREWHKKGATNVDDAKATSASIKALSNGLVYRYVPLSCMIGAMVRCVCLTCSCFSATKPSTGPGKS